jgi:hypothetical protein
MIGVIKSRRIKQRWGCRKTKVQEEYIGLRFSSIISEIETIWEPRCEGENKIEHDQNSVNLTVLATV